MKVTFRSSTLSYLQDGRAHIVRIQNEEIVTPPTPTSSFHYPYHLIPLPLLPLSPMLLYVRLPPPLPLLHTSIPTPTANAFVYPTFTFFSPLPLQDFRYPSPLTLNPSDFFYPLVFAPPLFPPSHSFLYLLMHKSYRSEVGGERAVEKDRETDKGTYCEKRRGREEEKEKEKGKKEEGKEVENKIKIEKSRARRR